MSWLDQEEKIFTKKFGDRLEGSHKEHLSFGIRKLLDQRSNNLNTLDEQGKADVQNSDVETQKPRKKRTMKKPRTCFTKQQIAILEARFVHQKYLGSVDRGHLAAALQMTDSQVKTWFQNRRTKWRRLQADELAKQGLSQAAALAISVLYGRTHNQGDEEDFEEDDE